MNPSDGTGTQEQDDNSGYRNNCNHGNGNNGNANGHDKDDDIGSGGCSTKGWYKALANGNGNKLGLYKKLNKTFGGTDGSTSPAFNEMFETGKIENILAAIDNVVNGEVNLPSGEQKKLFERIRAAGKGYTIIGTKYTYNTRNQLSHRENLIRYEEYDYTYDKAGSLLSDGRSKFEWNARGQPRHLDKDQIQ
ncbi:hypothetical protein [Paenibacillus sp. R14(2021)]|uniref:hypothetical protein n=1 Tax=Paenibacillus sp. R14(2021) TaxID=2859228 RepID=UPI001C615FFE|nr:hypothetical protein [Paenibacillus sp. R14(2021)]